MLNNALRIYPDLGDNHGKLWIIPDSVIHRGVLKYTKGPGNRIPDQDDSAFDQLVVEVKTSLGLDR